MTRNNCENCFKVTKIQGQFGSTELIKGAVGKTQFSIMCNQSCKIRFDPMLKPPLPAVGWSSCKQGGDDPNSQIVDL